MTRGFAFARGKAGEARAAWPGVRELRYVAAGLATGGSAPTLNRPAGSP